MPHVQGSKCTEICFWLHSELWKKKAFKLNASFEEGCSLYAFWIKIDDGDEDMNDSQDWLLLIDRGGLTHVNTTTFEMFVAMEYELRQHIHQKQAPNMLFLWSQIGKRAVHLHYYRWSSDNNRWKLVAFHMPAFGLKGTKSCTETDHTEI